MATAAVLYVKDLEATSAFYESCFEMAATHVEAGFRVLRSKDSELTLVRLPEAIAATVEIEAPPRRRASAPVKLVFDVADLDDVGRRVQPAGGHFDPDDAVWEFDGAARRDCLDPEGNVIQLRAPIPEPHRQ